jgi:hypothetical protein
VEVLGGDDEWLLGSDEEWHWDVVGLVWCWAVTMCGASAGAGLVWCWAVTRSAASAGAWRG